MDYKESLRKLQRIGYSLSSEKDIDALMHLILREAREMLSCDSGTLYIRKTLEGGGDVLEFSDVQNDSLEVCLHMETAPIGPSGTIPGCAAYMGETIVIEDAYSIPAGLPYSFSSDFDLKTGYRTISILAMPMKDRGGHVIGVISLYNRKKDFTARLKSPEDFTQVMPFTEEDIELAGSIASQAAIALENARLYQEIKGLFEGFVDAAVSAVESRDPATAGHSWRVAEMAVELARRVDAVDHGPWKGVRFTKRQLTELRYAGLLHDFGKIGVREHILLKKGSLDEEEIREMRSHVTHTYNFLKKIPWTRDFAGVADIACAHHEKINGAGYPHGMSGDKIPPQGKILMIADIFDALRAPDRPYRESVDIERAIRILEKERDEGAIDADLLEIFIKDRVWEILEN